MVSPSGRSLVRAVARMTGKPLEPADVRPLKVRPGPGGRPHMDAAAAMYLRKAGEFIAYCLGLLDRKRPRARPMNPTWPGG